MGYNILIILKINILKLFNEKLKKYIFILSSIYKFNDELKLFLVKY